MLPPGGCDPAAAGTWPGVTGDVPLQLGGMEGGRDRLLSSALVESGNPPGFQRAQIMWYK